MADSWNKKEREKKKLQAKKEKEERKKERRQQSESGGTDGMMAYLDADGNLTSTPPDPNQRREVSLEEIEISVPRQTQEPMEPGTREGVLTFFNETRGFGFIRDLKTRESVFVHVNDILEPLTENGRVIYKPGDSPKGPVALEVKNA
ncbi:MAG: cold shock domain-containing protein [Chitinophagia bacterium]|nr:cold shock domain-containing protein [Chitinophagia bacterium]